MNKILKLLRYTTLFFLISVTLAGDFTKGTIVLCLIISVLSALLAFYTIKVPTKLDIKIIPFLTYLGVLVISIYKSTFSTLITFIKKKGKIPTDIQKMPLNTRSGTCRLFICQAITLTPGTVSVKSKLGFVDILKIKPDSLDGAKKFDTIWEKKK